MTGKTNTIVLWVGVVGNKSCPELSRRDGVSTHVAVSEDALRDEILEYVKEWWQEEIGDLPMPQDRDQAIEAYFEKVESETFMIDSTTLAGDFENLFQPLPIDKVTVGYLEIGEWNPVTETYPWEGYIGLMLSPDGQVWAKVGELANVPKQEENVE